MVPTMIAMMLDHPDFRPERLASLQDLAYGASPMPARCSSGCSRCSPSIDLLQGYGMTECSSVLTVPHRRGPPARRRPAALGRPARASASTSSIQDDDGNGPRPASDGEVCARAGNFMREYWNRPEETAEAFRGGWYHTGDAGYLDDDGYLFLVDRVKDMIVTGGENVYSIEVENAIATHPAVAQVAVIGIPHDDLGRAGARHRRARKAGHDGHRGRDHRARPRVDRRLQGAEVGRVPHRAAAAVGRA